MFEYTRWVAWQCLRILSKASLSNHSSGMIMLERYAFHLCLFRRLLKRHLCMLACWLACLNGYLLFACMRLLVCVFSEGYHDTTRKQEVAMVAKHAERHRLLVVLLLAKGTSKMNSENKSDIVLCSTVVYFNWFNFVDVFRCRYPALREMSILYENQGLLCDHYNCNQFMGASLGCMKRGCIRQSKGKCSKPGLRGSL